ncbi:hypothetical protein [Frigidibacter sp.]|uniref:hypothetical protein n=1 Tax=Frigidibacter sp. TaxID=2586418 RepID=UPI002734ACE0|nr:hypothetical protein [Frigidibacter sp.]MDP3340068.1 hypothetical protein [Frigidibacter sp.]
MENLIWIGAAVSAAGLVGIVWCIVAVSRARRAGLEDKALRLRLKKAVTMNLAALMVSMLGLMLVVLGIVLA